MSLLPSFATVAGFCLPLLASIGSVAAQVDRAVPPGGVPLIESPAKDAIFSANAAVYATVRPPGPDQSVFRFAVEKTPRNPWDVQARWVNPSPLAKGEILLLTARARAVDLASETGECRITTTANRGVPPHDSWGSYEFAVGPEWTPLAHPFVVKADLPAGEFQFGVNFGTGMQTVELADVKILRFPAGTSFEEMPRPFVTYEGREEDAGWRSDARARIDKIRKGDLRIEVRNPSGEPVADAEVRVSLRRHAFPFGTSVRAFRLVEDTPDNKRYREILRKHFNRATFENEMKWRKTGEPHNHPEKIERAVDWLLSQGFTIRGHCLVWPATRFLPDDVTKLREDPAALRLRIRDHIRETMTAFRGRVALWDVLNEPVNNFEPWMKTALGPAVMGEWFETARESDPRAKLILNDYAMLSGGARNPRRVDELEEILRSLLENDVPIDGIGEQAHFDTTLIAPEKMLKTLDRFARLGLPIEITEFDIASSDDALRADYTRDFMLAAFSHPSITGITIWGFWAGNHWKPEAALWNRDWSIRPNGQAFVDLVTKEWWTEASGKSTAAGVFETRGFLGEYEVHVRSGGVSRKVIVQLPANGLTVPVRLPASTTTPQLSNHP
jgi:endo-1,4-beta-xylanase